MMNFRNVNIPELSISGTSTPPDHRLRNASTGYTPIRFAGKGDQMTLVISELQKSGFIPRDTCINEASYFYTSLGIDDMYFETESVQTIVSHILAMYGAKCTAFAKDSHDLDIKLEKEAEDHAVYIDTSRPNKSDNSAPFYETRIEERYLNSSLPKKAYRVETFRGQGKTKNRKGYLKIYFVGLCKFIKENPTEAESRNIKLVSDASFLEKVTANTLEIYQRMIDSVLDRTGPVVDMYEIEGTQERRLVIGYRQGTAEGYFSAVSDLYHYYGLTSKRKYVEQFSNGITVMSRSERTSNHLSIEIAMVHVMKEASLLFCIPRSMYQDLFVAGKLSLQESIYAHVVSIFVGHFLNRLGSEYASLVAQMDSNDSVHAEILARIKKRLRQQTFTRNDIYEVIKEHPDLVKLLYVQFATVHYINGATKNGTTGNKLNGAKEFTKPRRQLSVSNPVSDQNVARYVQERTNNEHELLIMSSCAIFNQHVLKTNFYQPTKVALSFRLDPSFLPELEYPQPLYGMFLVVGPEFRGFHLRFRDVARGGIRIVKSRSREAYSINARSLFDENYALASTQQRKNKDIPEGGAKGVILLDVEKQSQGEIAFQKYIDSLLDLLLEGETPGVKDRITDLYGKEEILFCGPDENTADLVDWATMHAKQRGAHWWKSFFTGKSPSMGGIPHDKYGMTSLSVRRYVTGIYEKLDIEEEDLTKIQTGGPDGDLGSNEVLLSKEKYVTIIDGSGVLHDPRGLNRPELMRLANSRQMISNFDITKLSKHGYRVSVDDTNKELPAGEIVNNGTTFRNTAHLMYSADVFVPCGGRPEAIDISNVDQLIENGASKIKFIVEGANLFITQDAKLALENAGCVIYKDASANKGGVTSSSLEVLASLSFDDEGFAEHMCVHADGTEPDFYRAYVKQVQYIIQRNAGMEFEAIWRENELTGKPRSLLSDEISEAIVKLDEELQNSSLWDNVELRNNILAHAFPQLLLEKIGLPTLLDRIPDAYTRSIFGSFLASNFCYKYGLDPSPFQMYEFIWSFHTHHTVS